MKTDLTCTLRLCRLLRKLPTKDQHRCAAGIPGPLLELRSGSLPGTNSTRKRSSGLRASCCPGDRPRIHMAVMEERRCLFLSEMVNSQSYLKSFISTQGEGRDFSSVRNLLGRAPFRVRGLLPAALYFPRSCSVECFTWQ